MSETKNNYIVVEVGDNNEKTVQSVLDRGFLKVVKRGFSSTREAEKWIKANGSDGLDYSIVKCTRTVRVDTVTRTRLITLA